MSNKISKELDDQMTAYCKQMVSEVMKFIETTGAKHGKDGVRLLTAAFLASYVATTMYKVLSSQIPKELKSDKEKADHTRDKYINLKTDVQNAVAAGLTEAMYKLTSRKIEYYCQLKAVPDEPANKLPC